jgi:hypothetical protein
LYVTLTPVFSWKASSVGIRRPLTSMYSGQFEKNRSFSVSDRSVLRQESES